MVKMLQSQLKKENYQPLTLKILIPKKCHIMITKMKQILHKTKQILRKIYKFIIVLNIISFILMFSILIQFRYFNTFNYPRSSFFFLTCVYLPLITIPIFIILIIFRINLKTSIIFLMVNVLIIYKAIEYLNAHLID